MSGKLKDLETRIDAIGQLDTVMTAMRGIASMRMQQALAALPGIQSYEAVIERALARLVDMAAPETTEAADGSHGRAAVVLFSAEHGFAGGYPERLADAAEPVLAAGGPAFIVGTRGIRLAGERNWSIMWSGTMATQCAGVGAVARGVAEALYRAVVGGAFSRVHLVHGRLGPSHALEIVQRLLLPLDLQNFRSSTPAKIEPLLGLPPNRLLERVTQEYIVGALIAAAMEGFAAENAARLATMESAHTHIADQLEALGGEAHRLRQEETTGELMDVVGGWRAAIRAEADASSK